MHPLLGMCGKVKFGSDSIFKTELSKKLTSVETVFMQFAIQIKSE